MHAPKFWFMPRLTFLALLFLPVSWIYQGLVHLLSYLQRAPYKASVPVICVGNLTIGGSGKTPTVLALAALLKAQGHVVAFLTRGYKGSLPGPVRVDPHKHTSAEVGDEPLLLARVAPTWVGRNRALSAQAAIREGATLLLLDDGLQHTTLHQDLRLCVVDAAYGFGNGYVMPAGPLRESLCWGLKRVDGLVVIGGSSPIVFQGPILEASVDADTKGITGPLLAFAGLAHPEKFFNVLKREGLQGVETRAFPDHHAYTRVELDSLVTEASEKKAHLITTEKDWVRLPASYQKSILSLPISLSFKAEKKVLDLVKKVLS
jgi:tetraacyldisaccharide 4'-kinase